ncbi:MAG: glycosyltransferase [Lachnospiraceae bacterium]|nr:glycosyltransferase [Lachnospiraceae bacterium]
MDKVSVIVPVYNSAGHLRKCLDSILYQTHEDLEIILVNDASENEADCDICREYALKNSKVKYIELPVMSGISETRNTGLEAAEGKYIMFVDSDDYLPDEEVIARLYTTLKKNGSDISIGNYLRDMNGKIVEAGRHNFSEDTDIGGADFRFRGFFSNGGLSYVWGKLYLSDFLRKFGIKFDDLSYAEDKLFNIRCFYHFPRYSFTDSNVYCYRFNQHSESNIYHDDYAENWMRAAVLAYEEFKGCSCPGEYEDIIGYMVLFATFFHAKQEYSYKEKSIKAIYDALSRYKSYKLARHEFSSCTDYARRLSAGFWKAAIIVYGALMKKNCLRIASLAVWVAAALGLDGALSSTGIFSRGRKTNKINKFIK